MLDELCSRTQHHMSSVISSISSLFWTTFYFFYFLVKGKPEWKCGTKHPEAQKNCCVDCKPANSDEPHVNGCANGSGVQLTSTPRMCQTRSIFQRTWATIKSYAHTAWTITKRVAHWGYRQICRLLRALRSVWTYIVAFFKKAFASNLPSKTLPATPKPFSAQSSCDSPSYNKVLFDPIDQLPESAPEEQVNMAPPELLEPELEQNSFYTQKTYNKDLDFYGTQNANREPSVPPPAPPPPPAKPIRIATSMERDVQPSMKKEVKEVKEVKGGVASFPADVMAELSGAQRRREDRGISAQREMTQSCHPDMPEWKAQLEDRFERTPTRSSYRASSVGPSMRKLEQVVSRLEDSSDNEAQFVFRPKMNDSENGYRMGRSVFTPLDEAEQMRETVNRTSHYDSSRPVTPACSLKSYGGDYYTQDNRNTDYSQRESELRRRARTVGPPAARETYIPPPFTQSTAYSSAPFTSHTSRRSKTPTAFDRGSNFAYDRDSVSQGAVTNTVRQWPPVSNATGAPVEKDLWFNNVLEEQDDGLITTMARRVVERKTEDNWKWRDEQGQLVDEQNQHTWKGELDTVLRDGPNQGRHWSRTVELMPGGDTRFQDVSRQYDNNYVVESVIRNY